jgi:glycosidase
MEEWILHDSQDLYYRNPFGASACKQNITFRLRVSSFSKPSLVTIKFWDAKGEVGEFPLTSIQEQEQERHYEVQWTAPSIPGVLMYFFVVHIDGRHWFYGNHPKGWGGKGQIVEEHPVSYQLTVYREDLRTPHWYKESTMYQIFPDRFYNGEAGKVLEPKKNSLIHGRWDNEPLYIRDALTNEVIRWDFFGGNLEGVRQKLAYLKGLGISVIYFNPVFEAPSNHRYDTADYHQIDPMLGDNAKFEQLCREAEQVGIRIILDGVFSHTGSDSIYFNKYGNYDALGAFQSQDSPYYSWYRFTEYPHTYESWWGVDVLPNVEELESSYQHFIYGDDQGVAPYWLHRGASGWRLDVADELPPEFIKKLRAKMKEVNPDSVLIGEVWEDASNKISYGHQREYLLGDELDSVMNYPFRQAVLDFITGQSDGYNIHHRLMSLYENYPAEQFYSTMNIIGTHDVPRALSIFQEHLDESLPVEDRKAIAIKRLKLAACWQMTFPGVPCIYYADEAGSEGMSEPLNRSAYPWGRENEELLTWYRQMSGLRQQYDMFKTGHWRSLALADEGYGYLRWIEHGEDKFGQSKTNNAAVILMNRSVSNELELAVDAAEWFEDKATDLIDNQSISCVGGQIKLKLQPLECKVLVASRV